MPYAKSPKNLKRALAIADHFLAPCSRGWCWHWAMFRFLIASSHRGCHRNFQSRALSPHLLLCSFQHFNMPISGPLLSPSQVTSHDPITLLVKVYIYLILPSTVNRCRYQYQVRYAVPVAVACSCRERFPWDVPFHRAPTVSTAACHLHQQPFPCNDSNTAVCGGWKRLCSQLQLP